MLGTPWRGVVCAAVLTALAAAQVRVSLQSSGKARSPLEQRIVELTMVDKVASAQQALWAAGEAAVPLLVAEVQRGGAAAPAALAVLAKLTGVAAAAVPVLQRTAAQPPVGATVTAAQIQLALARIDGPPCLLVPCYSNNQIVQLDLDGKVVRKVPCDSPWGVWPLPEEQLGAIAYTAGAVVRVAWSGETLATERICDSLTGFVRLVDGDTVTTSWRGSGKLERADGQGRPRWTLDLDAVRLEHCWNDEVLVVTRDTHRLRSFALADGAARLDVALPEQCYSAHVLPNGNVLLAAPGGKVFELDLTGKVIGEMAAPGKPNDAVRARDGRTFVASEDGMRAFAADGKQLWHAQLGYCGPVFLRDGAGGAR